jgi:hypothetical protein
MHATILNNCAARTSRSPPDYGQIHEDIELRLSRALDLKMAVAELPARPSTP